MVLKESNIDSISKRLAKMVCESIMQKHLNESEEKDDELGNENVVERNGVKIICDKGTEPSEKTIGVISDVISTLRDSNDDTVNSFNLTRSQISYELWPGIDKDAARSKLSQKINGRKAWREWELNKISNIISGSVA